MRVDLQYFRKSGKWYTDGHYRTEHESLLDIWDEVKKMIREGRPPGLAERTPERIAEEIRDGFEFMVLVDVPKHPHRHPRILVPGRSL